MSLCDYINVTFEFIDDDWYMEWNMSIPPRMGETVFRPSTPDSPYKVEDVCWKTQDRVIIKLRKSNEN